MTAAKVGSFGGTAPVSLQNRVHTDMSPSKNGEYGDIFICNSGPVKHSNLQQWRNAL